MLLLYLNLLLYLLLLLLLLGRRWRLLLLWRWRHWLLLLGMVVRGLLGLHLEMVLRIHGHGRRPLSWMVWWRRSHHCRHRHRARLVHVLWMMLGRWGSMWMVGDRHGHGRLMRVRLLWMVLRVARMVAGRRAHAHWHRHWLMVLGRVMRLVAGHPHVGRLTGRLLGSPRWMRGHVARLLLGRLGLVARQHPVGHNLATQLLLLMR